MTREAGWAPVLSGPVLKRQRDQVAEASSRHRVLAREQSVVGVHAQLVTPGHGLRDEIAAHPPGDHGRDRLQEEEPDMSAVPRATRLVSISCGNGGRKSDQGSAVDHSSNAATAFA